MCVYNVGVTSVARFRASVAKTLPSTPMDIPGSDWKRPPVIEVVLGVQFDALPALTNGHLGWFWGDMHEDFPNADDVPPIPPVVEGFGEELPFGFPALGFRHATGDSRLRMTSTDGTKMIQVQNGWLVANWTKKVDSRYPGFTGVKTLFDEAMRRFATFLKERELGVIKPNLWEVTYIDHLPVGTVWNTLADLPSVFPGLFGNGQCGSGMNEAVDCTWAWRLAPNPGRLRLSVQSARTSSEPAQEILLVRSIARGPLGAEIAGSLDDALKFGRQSVVDTFMGLASEKAKQYWQGD